MHPIHIVIFQQKTSTCLRNTRYSKRFDTEWHTFIAIHVHIQLMLIQNTVGLQKCIFLRNWKKHPIQFEHIFGLYIGGDEN